MNTNDTMPDAGASTVAAAIAASNVPISVADGAIAGTGAHRSLLFGLAAAR